MSRIYTTNKSKDILDAELDKLYRLPENDRHCDPALRLKGPKRVQIRLAGIATRWDINTDNSGSIEFIRYMNLVDWIWLLFCIVVEGCLIVSLLKQVDSFINLLLAFILMGLLPTWYYAVYFVNPGNILIEFVEGLD